MAGVTIVAATREAEGDFFANTALGKTLAAYAPYGIGARLYYSNTRGLPECYNRAIDEITDDDEILIFLHDDVFLPDFFWLRRVAAGLEIFSLIGVAGNTRRVPRQPAWAFTRIHPTEKTFEWDEQRYLSGIVGHGKGFPCSVTMYGPDERACLLLDGVLLGARKSTFTKHGIRFDEQFRFHFYDMDICRQFERAGLRMGTASISIIHDSGGNFGTPEWAAGYERYLQKWGQ
jgi:GT2 family glycosyltransferase